MEESVALAEAEGADSALVPLWGPPSQVASGITDDGPRCARLNGVDWIVWSTRFYNDICVIWYTYWSDGIWSDPQRFNVQARSAPAIAAYDGDIHVVWRNAVNNNVMWSVHDGHDWSDPRAVVGAQTSDAPALAACDGRLYLAWSTAEATLAYALFDGTEWGAPQKTGFAISFGPALAALGDTLYCAVCLPGGGPVGYCQLSSGWTGSPTTLGIDTDAAPALASDGKQLWTAWKVAGSSSVMMAAGTPTTGLSGQALLGSARTSASPGLCGDAGGIRAVWQDSFTRSIYTATTVNVGAESSNTVSGRAGPGDYVSLSVDTGDGPISHYPARANTNGAWCVTVDTTLTKGTILSASAMKDLSGPPSDAFVVVLGSYQPGCLFISAVTDTLVQGKAPLPGQVIKGWRSSDGKLVVDCPLLPPIGLFDGTDFAARYLFPSALEKGDTLNLVSQFPDNGTMTPIVSKPQGYMVTLS
ncbi:hypothetical protein [Martelella endophytica]|uniref:Exo-alpha-sialidase n=1 Tax=Martelella endophytica TaxID=1486262 RepID=A0A0D5LST5_MAREN|nr:hypothetical protein [Martelella endophytica]AJY47015.1 hypothetical protein TM49_17145 [Martelella endophytica]